MTEVGSTSHASLTRTRSLRSSGCSSPSTHHITSRQSVRQSVSQSVRSMLSPIEHEMEVTSPNLTWLLSRTWTVFSTCCNEPQAKSVDANNAKINSGVWTHSQIKAKIESGRAFRHFVASVMVVSRFQMSDRERGRERKNKEKPQQSREKRADAATIRRGGRRVDGSNALSDGKEHHEREREREEGSFLPLLPSFPRATTTSTGKGH